MFPQHLRTSEIMMCKFMSKSQKESEVDSDENWLKKHGVACFIKREKSWDAKWKDKNVKNTKLNVLSNRMLYLRDWSRGLFKCFCRQTTFEY